MRLGYFCYRSGSALLARFALYRGDPTVDVIFEGMKFTSFAPMIIVGPPMSVTRPFYLAAEQHGQCVGITEGKFVDNSVLFTERTGVFENLTAHELTERETLHAKPLSGCPGLSSTRVVLLSRKWHGYQLAVGKKGAGDWDVEYWDDEQGIYTKHWNGQRRATGWSTRYNGSSSECSAALAAVISGPQTGKAGWLLMGDDAGLQIGGAYGEVTGAMWVPSLDDFSGKLSDFNSRGYIGVPPISVMPELGNRAGNARQRRA